MFTEFKKSGNSLVLRIAKTYAKKASSKEGTEANI